jgi:hypothetical protein
MVARGGHALFESSQGAHDYVIRTGECEQIGEFGLFGTGQSVETVLRLGLAVRLRWENFRILPWTEEKLGNRSKKLGSAVGLHG